MQRSRQIAVLRVTALLLALLTAACGGSTDTAGGGETALRLVLGFDASWGLNQLTLHGGKHETTVPSDPAPLHPGDTVLVLLNDKAAGHPMTIVVWGLAQEGRVAYGEASATPILHQTKDVKVALVHLPCGDWCTDGDTSCAGAGVRSCAVDAKSSCGRWNDAIACPPSAPYCSLGQCAAQCIDECAMGEARCAGPNRVQRCGQSDPDSCNDWLPLEPCPTGTACEAGACKSGPCSDECTPGETQCSGNGVVTCGQFDTDDCLEWGPPVACPMGQFCSNGTCSEQCQDECSASTCSGLVWRQCGQFDLDPCKDLSPGTSCAPADSCKQGACDATAGCTSAPLVCAMPPMNTCVNSSTLQVYDASGTCDVGTCNYASSTVSCPNCPACDACASVVCNTPPSSCFAASGTCNNGSCSYGYADGTSCDDGNACTGGDVCSSGACAGTPVTCGSPPAATCISSTTLRTYGSPGTCSAGSCMYPPADTSCPNGCSGGACKAAGASVLLSAGGRHTCALKNGGVKCWGYNYYGQLGNNATTDSSVPVDVVGLGSGVIAVSAGYRHTCALLSGGGVQCWGYNYYGQLGNNSTTESDVPVDVVGLESGVIAVSAGGYDTCALLSGGGVQCWGYNIDGELGNSSTTDSHVPVDVVGLGSGVIAVSAGTYHTCALLSGSGLKCWGYNFYGELGNSSTTNSHFPVDVVGLGSGVIAVSAGYRHTCALLSGGGVQCWGYNGDGELGNSATANSHVPVDVVDLGSGVIAVSAGRWHTCTVLSGGGLKCWGYNYYGELGNSSTADSHVPVDVVGLGSGVIAVSAGGGHTCALLSGGGVKCWGESDFGQLGNNSTTESHVPVDVLGL